MVRFCFAKLQKAKVPNFGVYDKPSQIDPLRACAFLSTYMSAIPVHGFLSTYMSAIPDRKIGLAVGPLMRSYRFVAEDQTEKDKITANHEKSF